MIDLGLTIGFVICLLALVALMPPFDDDWN